MKSQINNDDIQITNMNENMDSWEFDRPTFDDDEKKTLKYALQHSKDIRELTSMIGYDPNIFEINIKESLKEKNLSKGIIIVRDKSVSQPGLMEQYKEFLKEWKNADPVKKETMKFEYKPPKSQRNKSSSKKKRKIKYPNCFGDDNMFGQYKCKTCEYSFTCKQKLEK